MGEPLNHAGDSFPCEEPANNSAPPQPTSHPSPSTGEMDCVLDKAVHREDVDRYRALAELVPHLVWILDRDGFAVFLNQRWFEFTGCTLDSVGRFGWLDYVVAEERAATAESFASSFESKVPFDKVCRLRSASGDGRWFLVRAVPIPNGKAGDRGWVGTCTDIHDEKRKEDIQRFMAGLDQCMRTASTPDNALLQVVTMLGEYLQVSYCAYQENEFFEDYAIMTVRQDYHVDGLKSLVGQYHSDMIAPAIKSLSAQGGTVVISDISTDARMAEYTAYFEENQLLAILYVPIMRNGVEVGDLSVVQSSPREWREDEIALVEAVANGTWLALDNARLYRESIEAVARQRAFARDVLSSVTDYRLRICEAESELPPVMPRVGEKIDLALADGIRYLRHGVRKVATDLGFDDERMSDLMTAASEAAMNAFVHAVNGSGWICSDGETIQVWVTDSGPGIAVEDLPQATLARGYSTAGTLGHGFKMIVETVDHVFLLSGATGTTVVIEQARIRPDPVF